MIWQGGWVDGWMTLMKTRNELYSLVKFDAIGDIVLFTVCCNYSAYHTVLL